MYNYYYQGEIMIDFFRILIRKPWFFSIFLIQLISLILWICKEPLLSWDFGYFLISVILSFIFFLFVNMVYNLLPLFAKKVFAIIFGFFLAFFICSSSFIYLMFGEYLSQYMMTYLLADPVYLKEGIHDYLLNWGGVIVIFVFGLFVWVWFPKSWSQKTKLNWWRGVALLLVPILYYTLLNAAVPFSKEFKLSMDTQTFISISDTYYLSTRSELRGAERQTLSKIPYSDVMPNIVIIINESWGKNKGMPFYGHNQNAMPFLSQWIEKEQENTFVFQRAFTSASATDVSVPSILAGMAPYEHAPRYHRFPFVWDFAHAAGYKTLFVSSQRLGDREYFEESNLDYFVTAEEIDSPIINDKGIDDHVSVEALINLINKEKDNPLFIVWGSNATHGPFQQRSDKLDENPNFSSRYSNALFVLDAAISKLIQSLKDTQKFDNTLFIITSDHGDTDQLLHPEYHRLYSFYDEIMNIPFIIVAPKKWVAQNNPFMKNLKSNTNQAVSNVDILPTIADLLGHNLHLQNKSIVNEYLGKSLLNPISDDRFVVSLNTNDFRHWNNEGFGFYWKDASFMFTNKKEHLYFDITKDKDQRNSIWDKIDKDRKSRMLNLIRKTYHLNRIYEKRPLN